MHAIPDTLAALPPPAVSVFAQMMNDHDPLTQDRLRLRELDAWHEAHPLGLSKDEILHEPPEQDQSRWIASDGPPISLYWTRVRNSAWRWDWHNVEWPEVKKWVEILASICFQGFTVSFDHTTGSNEIGYSHYARAFIDGVLGVHLAQNGKRVLTIALSFSRRGLLIHQVQLAEKRGNRWLYKLPEHYFSWVAREIYRASKERGVDAWLPIGNDAALAVWKSYTKDKPENWEIVGPRIASFYSRRIQGFRRVGVFAAGQSRNIRFRKLEAKS